MSRKLVPLAALLAAGASSRMRGGDKLLETVGGVPLLRLLAERLLALDLPIVVALPPGQSARAACLEDLALRKLTIADAGEGMAASFRAVAAAAADQDGLLCQLGDMPEITIDDMMKVLDAWRRSGGNAVARGCTADGAGGQPVILPRRLFRKLAKLRGDRGARKLLEVEKVVSVPLPAQHAVTDLDTPEEWAAWRESTGISR